MVNSNERFSAIESHGFDVVDVVSGQPVVEFPPSTNDAAAVHCANGELPVQRTEPGQLFEDVGARQHSVNTGHRQASNESVEQCVAVGHSERVGAERDFAAGGVVSGQNEELAVFARDRAPPTRYKGVNERMGLENPSVEELAVLGAVESHAAVRSTPSPNEIRRTDGKSNGSTIVTRGWARRRR